MFSKALGGIEEWLAQHTLQPGVAKPEPSLFCPCSFGFRPPFTSELWVVIIMFFFLVRFNSTKVSFSLPSIQLAVITPVLLFDLASFLSDAGAFPFIYPAIGHCKQSSVCLCICVSPGPVCVCVKWECRGGTSGYWGQDCVGRSVRKPPPLSSILQRGVERKQEERWRVVLLSHYRVVYVTLEFEHILT